MPHSRAPEVALSRETRYPVGDAAHYGRIKPGSQPDGPRPGTPVERGGPLASGSRSGAPPRDPDDTGADARLGPHPPRLAVPPMLGSPRLDVGALPHAMPGDQPRRREAASGYELVHTLTTDTQERSHVGRAHHALLGGSRDLG